MPQLLLELFSEEIPARMQAQAARDLERMAREHLAAAGFLPEAMIAFAGPRRLTLVVEGLPPAQADRSEVIKGPRLGAPPQAMEGFLRKAGLTQDQLIERDGVYMAEVHRPGRPTPAVIADMVEAVVRGFPWPKSMRWGGGTLRWVRPLQGILCVFAGEVVPFEIEGLKSGDTTRGHRFMGPGGPVRARDFDAYVQGLAEGFVVLDPAERQARILDGARTLCFARNLELVEDEGLLAEVAGLTEWPVPILGDMDPAFLDLPPEVIRTSMRTHQKFFAVRRAGSRDLAPHFVAVANIAARDGGAVIAAGNAKVLSARLSDARFFWDKDLKTGFEPWLDKLKGVTFHAKLGSMAERVERIAALARDLAPALGADPHAAAQAARLAKADLASGMVGEFPELQGIMGGYYAERLGLPAAVCEAVRGHYRPQGPGEAAPTAPLTVTVALADKLDTLIGFFSIDEKPTGSRDPFALRRAALGVIRIVLENGLRLPLLARVGPELLAFFADRLKVLLRDQGRRHDLVDAVFALGDDDLVRITARLDALTAFLSDADGANLLAGFKRASNILRAEEKKGPLPEGAPQALAGAPAQETALIAALAEVQPKLETALAAEDFAGAMAALAALRGPVDAFFEQVLVNSDVPDERANRLRLLSQVKAAMTRIADFSLIAG